jgi:hypothetical protein
MGFGLVTGLLSMGSQVAAGEAGRASTVEGAKSQAAIEEKSRAYALQMFEEDIEQQRPFYEAGQAAGVQYGAAVANRLDPTTSGAYQLQKGLIDEDLKDAPSYVSAGAYSQLGAVEGEKQKSRLMDMQQIGMGSAASAGSAGLNLGTMLANSYGLSGNVMAGGMQSSANQRQSSFNVAGSQLSGIPAYVEAGRNPPPASYSGPGYQGGMSSYTQNQGIR